MGEWLFFRQALDQRAGSAGWSRPRVGVVYFQFTKGHGFGQLMGSHPVQPAECALLYHRGQLAALACYCSLDDYDQQ